MDYLLLDNCKQEICLCLYLIVVMTNLKGQWYLSSFQNDQDYAYTHQLSFFHFISFLLWSYMAREEVYQDYSY